MRDGRDAGVDQLQSVVRRAALGLVGETGAVKHAVQEISGTIAGEDAAGAVGAVRGGRETNDQEPGPAGAEGRNRFTPVLLIAVGAALYLGHMAAVVDEPRTLLAGYDLRLQNVEAGGVTILGVHTPFRLDGKTALVTGGASGIGEATCRVLSAAGASPIIVDVDRARAEKLAAELPGAAVLNFDITDEAAVEKNLAGVKKLDILVNNAGIGLVGGVTETGLADFQRVFRVNVEGLFLVTKYALPLLLEASGVLVNIGSVAGQVGVKRRFAYCGSKGAVIAMTRQIAVDYPTQIRANCICPGTVETPFVEGYLQKYHAHEIDKMREELSQRQPVGRLGRPEEIAYLVLFLCSKESQFVNGASIPIDGGWTAA